ncbi:MAG: hypothetical protein Q6K70_11605 [Thermostichales cyanobacterium DRC_bins_46]
MLQILKRRECGLGWATDVLLPRCLRAEELRQLALAHQGGYRQFGNLVWIDVPGGRITASLVACRLTMRLGSAAAEEAFRESLIQVLSGSG